MLPFTSQTFPDSSVIASLRSSTHGLHGPMPRGTLQFRTGRHASISPSQQTGAKSPLNQTAQTPWIADRQSAASALTASPSHAGPLFRLRWLLYALAAAVALIPALWQWPAAYPWDHGSP